MVRNFVVIGMVSVIMAISMYAFRSLAPAAAEPVMDGGTSSPEVATAGDPGNSAASQSQMGNQALTSVGTPTNAQEEQQPGSPSAAGQTGGMTGAEEQSDKKMCPCMKMMMEGMGGQMNQANATQPISNPRSKEQAKQRVEDYLKSRNNPYLQAGDVIETAASYEIQLVTKELSLVNWVIIDKKSGQLKTQY